ncbi:DUF7426 family protein [Streptomyces similanensis]|uniref:DUF7426 domain-containing protein n=1 Tax=Streptomyces similanensis TaxID=1274988 RepID=A0ABP9KGN5_9ACTN
MAFKELGALLDAGLPLPIGGKTYTVPPPSAKTGLRVQNVMQAAATAAGGGKVSDAVLDDAAELDLYRDVLGTAYAEMIADGVKWPALKHCAMTAVAWIIQDEDAAERYWNSGGDPSQLAPNRATRRASSGTESSTRSRGSTSSTTRRQGKSGSGKKRPRRG